MNHQGITLGGLMDELQRFQQSSYKDWQYVKTLPSSNGLEEILLGYYKAISDILEKYRDLREITVQPLEGDPGKYPHHIMRNVREYMGLDPDDISRDEEFMAMSRSEILDAVTGWDGLIHYGSRIRSWIEDIYGIDLDSIPPRSKLHPDRDHTGKMITAGKWCAFFLEPGESSMIDSGHHTRNRNYPTIELFDMSFSQDNPCGKFVGSYDATVFIGRGGIHPDYRISGKPFLIETSSESLMIEEKDIQRIAVWSGFKLEEYEQHANHHALDQLLSQAIQRRSDFDAVSSLPDIEPDTKGR